MRFFMIDGVTRTEFKERERVLVGRETKPDLVIGMLEPLATVTDFPVLKLKTDLRLPEELAR